MENPEIGGSVCPKQNQRHQGFKTSVSFISNSISKCPVTGMKTADDNYFFTGVSGTRMYFMPIKEKSFLFLLNNLKDC